MKAFQLMLVVELMIALTGKCLLLPSKAVAQTTFALPVTRNEPYQGAYLRGFDFQLWSASGVKYHAGWDYYCSDLQVKASNCGVVVSKIPTESARGFGNTVMVRHTLGNFSTVFTQYSHLVSFAPGLTVGQRVLRGDVLGVMGMTGRSNEIVHLHFEVKRSGDLGNPWQFGLVPVNTQFGYMPRNAGNASAVSATTYGFLNPASCYGNFSMLCSPQWQR